MIHRYFTVLNMDEAWKLSPIHKGLKIDEANQDEMKMLLKAQKRLEFEEEDQHMDHLKPLEPASLQ